MNNDQPRFQQAKAVEKKLLKSLEIGSGLLGVYYL